MLKASCLCGAVQIDVTGDIGAPGACHCVQCRKQSGHYWASVDVKRDAVAIKGEDKLTWFQASPKARRGFCATCGSFLFWDKVGGDMIEISMGAFDGSTGAQLSRHIFVAEKGDYYDLRDGVPQSSD
jgi:hypothetical protein